MIPLTVFLCKHCKEKDNQEILLQDYEIVEPSYKLKGMFCNRCLIFYVTEGELDVRRFNQGGGTAPDRIKWPSNPQNN